MPTERVNFSGKEIVLVGTAHISEESARQVKEAIAAENPQVVGVELDIQRFSQLKSGENWQQLDLGQVIASGQTYLLLVNLLLANLQRQVADRIGIRAGAEMLEAINESEQKGIPIALLDRSVSVTLKRAMKKMGLIEKLKFLYSVVLAAFGFGQEEITKEKIEEIKQKDVMTQLMEQLSKEFPSIKKVLVDERDTYIANKIMQIDAKKIVAVVGAGHIDGIKKNIGKIADLSALETVDTKKSNLRFLGYLIPAFFIALLGYAFFVKGIGTTISFLALWIVVTGGLSALGVLLVRGHPFSIIAAFIAAPVTTLHPLLAAGWFAGYVEAKMKSPKVADFESLRSLNSFGDFTKNSVTKILLVVAFANFGATIGVVVAFPAIIAMIK